jgi:hypothetical protein
MLVTLYVVAGQRDEVDPLGELQRNIMRPYSGTRPLLAARWNSYMRQNRSPCGMPPRKDGLGDPRLARAQRFHALDPKNRAAAAAVPGASLDSEKTPA